ncbi:histidine kinase [Bacillus sp. FJAT-22090]|uniref:sensor histidine kinase n=1 Tax=Bacillus sp. FJAT-22090 TaxID=1581038 RepID=UPI0006AEDBC1|nr:HAMP domain-containing sensor histidine kinase [Bacillus sp. FJAT-22090]ALC86772.1 histidine kinase [Bacillus sp. FJAT-22090]
MDLTEHFFFNLSLLIVLMFFCVLWVERLNNLLQIQQIAILYFVVSFFLCFAFSYPIHDGFLFDLKNIPLIISGLYMGLGPLLGLLTICIKAFYGINDSFWVTFTLYGVITISLWRLSPVFLKLSSNQRIYFSVGLTFLFSLIQTVLEFLHLPYPKYDLYFAVLFIQPLGVGMIAYFIEEITRTILLRQHLLNSKRLEAVEQMGASISHEIRNPLTAAIGFVQLLQSENISTESRAQYLSIIKKELKSAERVIQDYLTFSKTEDFLTETIHVHDQLMQAIQALQLTAKKKSIKIKTFFSNDLVIIGDKQKFHQCFINIMKNGIEAMPRGGTLTIETESTSSAVNILIKDTGTGMTPDQLVRLGEPYYSTKGNKGTGLGLMVVYSIVSAMNGTIHVESELNSGTTFKFTFPLLSQSLEQIEILENKKEYVLS